MNPYGESLYKGAATYYAKHRPMYPSSLIRFLIDRFSLNGEQQILDLGCGPGLLSLRLTDWCKRMAGVDQEPHMIEEARRLHKEMRVGNIDWYTGNLEAYLSEFPDDRFHLVTMAKSFHWMDRAKTLELLYPIVQPGGGVAIIDNFEPAKKLEPWQETFNRVVEKWYGKERRAGETFYSHPERSHSDMISESNFTLEEHKLPSYEVTWTVDSIIGNHYSTSYGSKRFIEGNAEKFEDEVRAALYHLGESGRFKETMNLYMKLGMKEKV